MSVTEPEVYKTAPKFGGANPFESPAKKQADNPVREGQPGCRGHPP